VQLLHPPIPPWAVPGPAGLDLVLLTDEALPPGRAFVRTLPDNEEVLLPLQPDGRDAALWRWRAQVPWDGGNAQTRYAFVVAGDEGAAWLGADGLHGHVPPEALHFRVHRAEQPPAWVADQVFYQVFPDRFARGPGPVPAHCRPWGEPLPPCDAHRVFYGGDLPGLLAQLPYLQDELGISALYLNPVFASPSNHRYDTTDYTQVDPLLGGNAALQALREATAQRGMRLVLDAVVNHTGAGHAWTSERPGHYACDADGRPLGWKGHASLPVLDFAVPAVQQAVYGAPDAILRQWLRPPWSIDGWRLDVVHMLGEGTGAWRNDRHVRAIRRAIREENPQAYVLGEHFAEATRWLQGDQEDGAMNYHGLAAPVQAWLAGQEVAGRRRRLPTADFDRWLASAIAPIPYANQLAQLNLLDSHDTPRLLTVLGGDAAAMALALLLLFTRPGVPCLYYGDEVGLPGAGDPDCRRCFPWDRTAWDLPLWQHCRRLVQARRTRAEWARGATLTLARGDDWLAYARYTGKAATIVVANRGPALAVDLPLHTLPLAPGRAHALEGTRVQLQDGRLRCTVPAGTGVAVLLD